MGNGASQCFLPPMPGPAKLIFWGGTMQLLPAQRPAGEIMFSFPDCVICHADSFFIGQPLPILSLEDELLPGNTYFVLPVDRLPCQDSTLTAACFASLSPSPRRPVFSGSGQNSAFVYINGGADGRTVIKVQPEFIINLITERDTERKSVNCGEKEVICSTPELKKHYAQLVGSRDRPWSPRLETIKERSKKNKLKLSPARLPPMKIYRTIGEKYGVSYSEDEILSRYRWAYEQPWGRSRLRYVDDGRPFWQYIVSSSTGCSDTKYFEELYHYYTT